MGPLLLSVSLQLLLMSTKVRPLFKLMRQGSDNSPSLNHVQCYIDQSNRDFYASEGIWEALTF